MTMPVSEAETFRPDAGARGIGRRRVREVALNTGALLGLVCIATTIASLAFGVTPLVFRSGSMAPTIDTGALALARTVPAEDVRPGDIITVDGPGDAPVTHRVTFIDVRDDGTARVTLQGDANEVADPMPYSISEAPRVFAHVPYAGYVVSWLSRPVMVAAAGVLAAALLIMAFRPGGVRGRGSAGSDSSNTDFSGTADAPATNAASAPEAKEPANV